MSKTFSEHVRKLMNKQDLTREQSKELMHYLLTQDISGDKFLAFSVASQTKGESTEELLGIFDALAGLTEKYVQLPTKDYMDLSSSGGGKLKKINVSTLSSLVASSSEVPVPKQSFFGITSLTGSSDILAAIGILVPTIDNNKLQSSIKEADVGFYHHLHISPELKNLVNFGNFLQEKDLGINTPFNMVCPMYTPIPIKYRLFGVNNPDQLKMVAQAFKERGVKRAWIVHGVGGMDEISVFGETQIASLNNGLIEIKTIKPEDAGLPEHSYEDVAPVDKESNIKDFLRIAYGLKKGPKRDLILINAGAGLYISEQAESLKQGVEIARERLESGDVGKKIDRLVELVGQKEVLEKAKMNYLT